ncbi:dynein heavy chain 1, axonemal isoform X2 [Nasonia vitripennis]|uniref:AAA+ ATPase domain-containing protein n=1 Tax=Nasonia vitripennis TaxID=7425 RepID=A0A7M7TAH6_NASVI|nr:dynein heavy chain 1, axonemal isoform X2 [Nasonia vitripennis]
MELGTKRGVSSRKRRCYYSELVTVAATLARDSQLGITRSCGSPTARNLVKATPASGHVIPNERWISFPQDPSTFFPGQAFSPKVQMGLEMGSKRLVRNVEVQRRRRLYRDLNLENILYERGIRANDILDSSFLPLETFDNEEYDCRTPDEWLDLGLVGGRRYPVPAEALLESSAEESTPSWRPVAVINYVPSSRLWQILTLDSSSRTFHRSRLYFRFFAEDPRIFAQRIEAAMLARRRAEVGLRYQLYLDCMPIDGVFSDVVNEPLVSETNHIASVRLEVERHYQRVMWDLECRLQLRDHPAVSDFLLSLEPIAPHSYHQPSASLIPSSRSVKEIGEFVQWNSLYVHTEVYEAMLSIFDSCRQVSEMSLFSLKSSRALTLDEFFAQQLQTSHSIVTRLREQWIGDVTRTVRMCLRDIGKGWFDLRQRRSDVYDVMKLKRFMALVKHHMQSALRTMIESSSMEYSMALVIPNSSLLDVAEDFTWGMDLKSSPFESTAAALFEMNLCMNDEGAFYETNPELFEVKIDHLLTSALQQCQQIPEIEPMLLNNLTFVKHQCINGVSFGEDSIRRKRERLWETYRKAVIPLLSYAKAYDRYIDLFKFDVDDYINNFKGEEYTISELRDAIHSRFSNKWTLEQELPDHIVIGAFYVNVDKVRKHLIDKQQNIVDCLLRMHADCLRRQTEDALEEFRSIYQKLKTDPLNIEQLTEMREWMEGLPVIVDNQRKALQKVKVDYDALDAFHYNLNDEEFEAKWQAMLFPAKIHSQIAESQELLEYLGKEKFYQLQLQDENSISERIDTLLGSVSNICTYSDVKKIQDISLEIKRTWKILTETQEHGILLNSRQKLFGAPVVPFERLTKLVKQFEPYKSFWLTVADWLNWKKIWMENPLVSVDGAPIEGMLNDMLKTMSRSAKTFQDQPDLSGLANEMKSEMELFKPCVGIIQALRNPGMKSRHMQELSDETGIKLTTSQELSFQQLVQLGVMNFQEKIKEKAESAAKEHAIEEALHKMTTEWESLRMEVIPYKDTGTYIMKISDEVQLLLDDHAINTQQIGFSPFKAAFEEEIDDWAGKLKLAQEVILLWIDVQRIWMYLEPIFSSEDINRQLPVESKKYSTMERNWRRIMKQAFDNPIIMKQCADRSLLESLRECLSLLEVVQKGLSDYLESRRMLFPRFFFLSDDELLEILAQTRNVRAVQPHLKKCFENMKELRFEQDLSITRMYSAEGEEVVLDKPVRPEGSVENWLGAVEETMRSTIRQKISQALERIEGMPRKDWVIAWPGQVSLCGGQTSWTSHVERAIAEGRLDDYFKVMISQLDDLRSLVRNPQTEIQRLMLEAIITIEVHARDVLLKLIKAGVSSANDFDWISQLRYYWMDSELKVRAVNAEFEYGYEYLGNNGRLVITPLTDRCYLTLTGALHLKFGGAPAGPAGTGKTETTKDLAKAFAIQCVVFNCSDQLDFMSMGKFFKGLASSGAWACFDEFNRIDIEVLSVIAQQIMTIQKAQQLNADRFLFEGVELGLKASCAVFITMNPGYAGRTELPDNLKALFRPVAMMVPNYTLIAEISLFSCGFIEAKTLAAKITATFKLSSEQLSAQDHYDFGMRSVKTVIAVAGILKREQTDMGEEQICLRALRDVNVPKFLKDDLKLFDGIVSDLFPKVEEKSIDYDMFIAAVRKTIADMGLADVKEFVKKVIQLYETTLVRHGLMLVGPTGSGKTKCYEVLQKTCTRLRGRAQPSGKPFVPVHCYVLNPKSVSMGQLYGEFDPNTHEWTDGILPMLIRAGTAATDDDKRWYVFDGPVDAVWIENMNTVLDDNKKLCLSSGEIMRLSPTQTMIFEVADLKVASPATVSRCGMVYLEPEGLGIKPLIDCWVQKLPERMTDSAADISRLAYLLLPSSLQYLRSDLREIVTSVDSGLIRSYFNLMDSQIASSKSSDDKSLVAHLIEPWSAFALVWSIGATCDYDGRYLFSDWLRRLQRNAGCRLIFPEDGLVYDYRLHESEEESEIRWVKWLEDVPAFIVRAEDKFSDMEVPTVDMVRTSALIDRLLIRDCNVLCVGPTGSGKTLTVSAKLSRDMPKRYVCDFVIFSARTSANQTQDLIDGKLDKRRKGVYGPPVTKRQIFFIDDLNMPALETYGAQPPIELLRQFMDFKGWYDRKDIGSFRLIEDVSIIGAMGPPGGGRNPVTSRLLRHFHFVAFPEMEDETKKNIFGSILSSWLSRTSQAELLGPMVDATVRVFATICKELLPTPDKSHYTFNVRDLGKVVQGILMAEPARIRKTEELLLLWYHENCRVFSDRLTNEADRNWFEHLLLTSLQSNFNYDVGHARELFAKGKTLFYSDFCNSEGRYERVPSAETLEKSLLDFLEDYNGSSTTPLSLVLFEDAMAHVCRITRILRQSPGNVLLLGMGGSGRQSLTKLSAHIADYGCFQIELSQAYSTRDWREDVKQLLLKTGLQHALRVFLFSDTQIKSELFLEDINNVLSSGDVPNIYQPDELDSIFQAMRSRVQEAGLQINRSNLLAAYQKSVRNNLHMVVSMCPVGEQFRARIRQFPALVNLCTIDWFDPWPDSALQRVAMHFLQNVKDEGITDEVLTSIVDTCQFMHSSVVEASQCYLQELNRHNYVTPTCYLELISSYGDLLAKQRNELTLAISRLSTGLERLASTEVEVKEMQTVLEKMKPELERAAVIAAEMIEQIARDTVEAEKARAEAAEQEHEASKLKRENQAIRDEAEADLSTARPMLEAAEASLKALNKNDVTEVKAMKRPPVGVVLVIEAICIIKKVKPHRVAGEKPGEKLNDYWTPGSQMLADAGHFLASLENYDKQELNDEMIEKLRGYVESPDFQPQKVLQASKACHSLCLWVHAMYNYYFVNLRVAPKMEALSRAEKELAITEATLVSAMAKLREVQDGLDRLQEKFQREQARQAELELQKQLCEERMSRAVRLISGLAGERRRWLDSVQEIRLALTNVVGDILLSAGAIAYLTPFIDTYRKRLLSLWYGQLDTGGVPHTAGCTPVTVLGDPLEIRGWQMAGLPRDSLSVENAVLVGKSKRWPLFIDPQGQANRWIRNMGQLSGLSTVRMTDKDLLRVVESCVRFGRACLIENVALELEASLDTILMRSLFRQAGQLCVKIADNIVPYNPDFRLYLTSKLPNPHYAPEIAVKVLLVNFSLTASALQDQMLTLVVMQERPELEETRSALILSSAQMRRELKDIEARILQRLALSEGSAVDDIDLVLTLEASKLKSEEIKVKVHSAEATQADIDSARSLYIPVSERAQILFFCLLDLQQVDTMYQYSLEWFVRIFISSIIGSDKSESIGTRVKNINEHFTYALFVEVCRSLFEKHKLHFAFLLCIRIQMEEGLVNLDEWRFLLSGTIPPEEKPNPAKDWLPQRCWIEIQSLQALPKFQNFVSFFKSLISEFKRIFDDPEPESASYPEPWQSQLDDFSKLLVLKCLRPDKVTNAMQRYIAKNLGERFVEPQTSGLDAIYEESSPTTPLIFILSSGTDPASELHKFAEKLKMARKLYSISLGQGQGPRAEVMLRQSVEAGYWLFFQNCHLAPSWMPKLELLVESLPPEMTHRDFRLWLTSMPSAAFPVSILQNGSKMTIEPPRGIKANVLRAYTTQVPEMREFLESEHPKVGQFKALLFSLCLFHAVLLERRKFGPLGFNIPYEFTDGDFAICMSQLHMFLMEYEQTPFKVLIYTAGHINYGGRLTDDWDRRCVLTLLQNFYNEAALSTGHPFDAQGYYRQPSAETSLADYITLVKGFPLNDEPGVFGLHANADISYARAETYSCLATLLALQPREIGGSIKGKDEVTAALAESILKTLPETFDLADVQNRYPVSYEESLNTVLLQESRRYNALLAEMSSSLNDLLRGLKGLVVMSEKLESMAELMYSNRVPENWQSLAFASLKPLGAWMEDLRRRVGFIRSWQVEGIPAAFWISGFYFPQAFLTGTLQNFARRQAVSVDTVDFAFEVLPDKPRERPREGCVVYGLFLEGCRWDGVALAESMPKELFTEMHPILLLPETKRQSPESGIYECPVYKTVQRAGTLSTTGHSTNFVLTMEIPSRLPQAHWIARGVALICSLDY